ARRDLLGAARRAAVQKHHIGMLRVCLFEAITDQAMIVEVETARESDLRTFGHHDLDVGPALRSKEIAAINDCCRHRGAVDHRSSPGFPSGARMNAEQLGRRIADKLEAVAAFEQRQTFADEALELHREDFGAVLLMLACPLRGLVNVELTLDAID